MPPKKKSTTVTATTATKPTTRRKRDAHTPTGTVTMTDVAGAAATTIVAAAPDTNTLIEVSPLTDKQERFVAEYLVDLNAAAAARRAGYSEASAEQQGYENLRKPQIAAAIAAGKAQQLKNADLSAARVLEELRRIGFADVRVLFDEAGNWKPIAKLTAEEAAQIDQFEVIIKNASAGDGHLDTIHKIKRADRLKALELLAKHFGLTVEKVEIKDSGAEARIARLVAARKRLAETKPQ